MYYLNAGSHDVIGKLEPERLYIYTIQYQDTEDSLEISYVDSSGKKNSTTAVGFVAKYDKQCYRLTLINQSSITPTLPRLGYLLRCLLARRICLQLLTLKKFSGTIRS